MGLAFVLGFVLAAGVPPAMAAPGELDPSFSNGGTVTVAYGAGYAVEVQPDGKTLVAGCTSLDEYLNSDAVVLRYTVDGNLDPTFSGDGRQELGFRTGPGYACAADLDLTASGSIIVGGNSGGRCAVARLTRSGDFDLRFSGDGRRIVTLRGGRLMQCGFSPGQLPAVEVRSNGQVLVAGDAGGRHPHGYDFSLASFNANGTPVKNFAHGRGLLPQVPGRRKSPPVSIALAPDGKLVVAATSVTPRRPGSRDPGVSMDVYLGRINRDGSFDRRFSRDGFRLFDLARCNCDEIATDVAVQRDSRIVLIGQAAVPETTLLAVGRLNEDGKADRTFARGGRRRLTFPGYAATTGASVSLDPDQNVLVGATPWNGRNKSDLGVARLRPNGGLDDTFSDDGYASVDLNNSYEGVFDLDAGPEGEVAVSGTTTDVGSYLTVARILGR